MADFGASECRVIWPFFGVATIGCLLRADIPDATRAATDAPGPHASAQSRTDAKLLSALGQGRPSRPCPLGVSSTLGSSRDAHLVGTSALCQKQNNG
jgi:hypothetical protein